MRVMQQVAKIMKKNPRQTSSGNRVSQKKRLNTTSLPSSGKKDEGDPIDNLFLTFGSYYGHVWRSQFKSAEFLERCKDDWREGLKHFGEDEMKFAISCCRRNYDFPPTMPQFIALCVQERRRNENCYQPFKNFKRNPELAGMHLKKIKKLISKNKGEK